MTFPPADVRFWSRVEKTDGCWNWTGPFARGYGKFCENDKMHSAHRWLFIRMNGPIGKTVEICHKCNNRKCVRPDHVYAGTRSDNMRDCARAGNMWVQKNPMLAIRGLLKTPAVKGEKHGQAKLTESQALEVISLKGTGLTRAAVGARFGLDADSIGDIWRGKNWRHLPRPDGALPPSKRASKNMRPK